jgi:hypothetical protein
VLSYFAFAVVLIIAFYTILFAIENYRAKNRIGFWAVLFLALISAALPFYMLFLFN